MSEDSVVHFTNTYYRRSQNWIRTQIVHHERYDPYVLTVGTANLETDPGPIPKYYATLDQSRLTNALDGRLAKLFGFRPSRYWQARRHGPDIMHAHFGPKGYEGLDLAESLGIPLVTTFYGYDLSRLPDQEPEWRHRYQQLFSRGALFLTEGTHMRDRLIELGCPSEKATVQHLGVDVSEYTLESRRRAPEEPLRILSVGRFTEKKGLSYAIEALAAYLQRGGRGTLTLVGDAGDEVEQQRTKRRIFETINAHDLDDDVDWRGFLSHDELVECFYDHHLLLAPSVHAESGDNEGGAPVTLIEAAATGMPIVATEHCDIPEVVQQQETGLLVPERNADMLADHLMQLFEHPKLLKRMGDAGRERVEEEYNAVVQGRRLERLYDQARKEESVTSQSE